MSPNERQSLVRAAAPTLVPESPVSSGVGLRMQRCVARDLRRWWPRPPVRHAGRVVERAEAVPIGVLEELVDAATAAPSSHNTQPWLFELHDGEVDLHADRIRALPVNDPHDRELTISCGCALRNLELAAAEHGLTATVSLLPDDGWPDLLARVRLEPSVDTALTGADWSAARNARRTIRGPFDTGPDAVAVGGGLAGRFVDEAASFGVTAHLVEGEERNTLADLVAEGDRVQFADPHWRRELASWMHPRRHGEGLVVPEVVGLATRAVVSAFDLGRSTASKDHDLLADAPVVVVLATDADDVAAWLDAGRALQQLLLVATSHGLQAGYLNQPCQVVPLRGRLQELVPGGRHPQVVVRLGPLAEQRPPTPRRPLDDVIITPTA